MADNTDLSTLEKALLAEVAGAGDLDAIERVRIAALGMASARSTGIHCGILIPDSRTTFPQ